MVAIAWLLSAANAPAPPADLAATPAELAALTMDDFEKGIATSPAGPVFAAIQTHYPTDYEEMMEVLLARVKASSGRGEEIGGISSALLTIFFRSKSRDLINAPIADLNEINGTQLALARGLAKDHAALCAEFVTSDFGGPTPLPQPYRAQLMELNALMVAAARNGQELPRDERRGKLDDEDALAWHDQLIAIEPSPEVQALLTRNGDEKAPDDLQCRLGIASYAAIAALPSDQAARVSAHFMAPMFEPETP